MPKYDAVDRLMALATEKRADRMPTVPATEASLAAPARANALPELIAPASTAAPTAGDRGRRLLKAIQPILPAVAGAMRLVDHGGVQAVARLLPLLSGGIGSVVLGAKASPPPPVQEAPWRQELATLRTASEEQRRQLDALQLQAAASEDELRRSRTQLERLDAELDGKRTELRAVADRVRMLAAATIILFMLVIAQMILLVVMFHR